MKKVTVFFFILFAVTWTSPALALESLVLYDNFSNTYINQSKWYGLESGNGGLETIRAIESGKLRLMERYRGRTDSDIGDTGGSGIRLAFVNSSKINSIRADVRVTGYKCTGSSTNPSPSWVAARVSGFFFNSNPQTGGGMTNDVGAYILISRKSDSSDGKNTLRVKAKVSRCKNFDCSSTSMLFDNDLGTIDVGVSETLLLRWDKAMNRFIFRRGSQPSVIFKYTLSDSSPANFPVKRLDSSFGIASSTSLPWPSGMIDALFDNIYVNASALQ
ncbi:MAG: hypothetical protein AB9866_23805 [Syntrophobacteraceae bacterium]